MKKTIIRPSLKILIVFLILISLNLLASANNQAPEILEKEVGEQNYNISIECSLNYDINLDDSARATIYLEIENLDEKDLSFNFVCFKINEKPSDISDVKIVETTSRRFNKSKSICSSLDESLQNLGRNEYFYYVEKPPKTSISKRDPWVYYFCVARKSNLGFHKMIPLYISYSIENIVDYSENDTKYLHIPPKKFNSFWVVISKYEYSWDNVFKNESVVLRFLKDELDIRWAENATISESDDGKTTRIFKDANFAEIKFDEEEKGATLKISDNRTYYLKRGCEEDKLKIYKLLKIPKDDYLFSWDNVPGNDNERLLKFLKDELDFDCAENAGIQKLDDGKTINIIFFAQIMLDDDGEGATLKTSDMRTYYLKWVNDRLNIYTPKTQTIPIQAKSYNILINLPQDRYKYSQLVTLPHPYPDVTSVHGNSPTLSWQFTPKDRDWTRVIVPSYKIQKDEYMITLDRLTSLALGLGLISVGLGIFSIILAFWSHRHKLKWIPIGIFVIVIYVVIAIWLYYAYHTELHIPPLHG
jgi:hypothetical protein